MKAIELINLTKKYGKHAKVIKTYDFETKEWKKVEKTVSGNYK